MNASLVNDQQRDRFDDAVGGAVIAEVMWNPASSS